MMHVVVVSSSLSSSSRLTQRSTGTALGGARHRPCRHRRGGGEINRRVVEVKVAKQGGEGSGASEQRQGGAGGGDVVLQLQQSGKSVVLDTATNTNNKTKKKTQPSQNINIIPVGRWADGIPPAMGGHYMPSGSLAPLSNSKGPGVDIAPMYFTYPGKESEKTNVVVYENGFAAANGLADAVAEASAKAIRNKGSFTVALSGGSLVKSLSALVGRNDVDFSKWYVFFVDERVVPLSHEDSNYKAAAEELLRRVPIPSSHVVTIKEGLSAEQTAEHYAGQMLNLSDDVLPRDGELPVLDLVLLGVGPDGHVASLFPNSKATAATHGWVLPVTASPKPPSERITMTLPVINAARNVIVTALGEGKAEVVQRALEVQSLPGALPVQMVRPQDQMTWILDGESAENLNVDEWENRKSFPRTNFA